MAREQSAGGVERENAECPDCGADLDELYERHEMKIPCVTGWCPKCGVAKAVPLRELRADTAQEGDR